MRALQEARLGRLSRPQREGVGRLEPDQAPFLQSHQACVLLSQILITFTAVFSRCRNQTYSMKIPGALPDA